MLCADSLKRMRQGNASQIISIGLSLQELLKKVKRNLVSDRLTATVSQVVLSDITFSLEFFKSVNCKGYKF